MDRVEEADYITELNTDVYAAPPLCTFQVTTSKDTEPFPISISKSLRVSHLVEKMSNHLKVACDKIKLYWKSEAVIGNESVATLHRKYP